MRDEEAIYKYLQMIAPGTQLYEGLESILKAKTGALIVIGDTLRSWPWSTGVSDRCGNASCSPV